MGGCLMMQGRVLSAIFRFLTIFALSIPARINAKAQAISQADIGSGGVFLALYLSGLPFNCRFNCTLRGNSRNRGGLGWQFLGNKATCRPACVLSPPEYSHMSW